MQQQSTYAQAVALKHPEQIVIAIAKDARGKFNPITLGWTTIASGSPPMMAISVGKTRYSLEAIRSAGEFVIALPSEHQKDQAVLYGTKSGRDTDKFAATGEALQPAAKIDCVLLSEAVANFECELISELDAGDHVLLLGQIVCSHRNQKPLRRLYTVGPNYAMAGLDRQTPA